MASISNNQESANKVQRTLNKNDQISSLSDSLLIHILSFLPTKYAVGTSILSSRWKRLWASVPTLDFDSKLWFEPNSDVRHSSNFLNFVERVLFNHDLSCIQKFRLYCDERKEHKLSRICTWIGVAIKRGVQELDIRIGVTEEQNFLPSSLFTCPTLVVLKLGLLVSFSVPWSVHFKSLKVLHISLGHPSNELTRNLFRNCPVLEDLIIKGDIPCYEKLFFDVSTPALKSFKFDIDTDDGEDGMHEIMVNAPILEYLFIRDYCLPSYVLKNLTSLVKAYVNVGDCWSVEDCWRGGTWANKQCANRVFVLLRNIFSVKQLSLGARTMGAFDYADDGELPLFSNLIRLELNVDNCYGWKRLLHLLNSMPNLEYLVLKKLKMNKRRCQHNDSKDFKFVEPEVVPCCLSIHVQEIEVTGFQGRSCELEQKLIEYFLRNAKVLRKMTIKSCNSRTTSRERVSQ